ncbi:MAG: transcriptional regulator [Hyphomicrobiales bacterium]|nr:MAG: transcriptional regulator [Hyphomicrobiales bacterium]
MVKTLGSARHTALIAYLIEARERAGLTQTELAEKLGEYQSFVARLESGQRRVDVIEFLELAEVLGFDAAVAITKIRSSQAHNV